MVIRRKALWRKVVTIVATLFGVLTVTPAFALDFLSIAAPAVLFDAPSSKAKPLFVINPGTPVERVISLEGWVKVRDNKGDLAWIEKKYLSETRQVIVVVDRAQIRAATDDKAAILFEAERDVVLTLLETLPDGWAKVKHRDGQEGFIKSTQVWGL
ncbi:MAG TPA: SH3 domain-containing protein [Rugosibacter sp.]